MKFTEKRNDRKTLIKIAFVISLIVYLTYLFYLVFFSQYYGKGYTHQSINPIPLKTISEYLYASYNQVSVITNILGNIAAFIPLGFLLPAVSNRFKRFLKAFFIILLTIVIIETAQFVTGVGVSDIDDVILNVLGGTIGYLFYMLLVKILKTCESIS